MADPLPNRETWRVPQRAPAIAAVALLVLVAVLLLLAWRVYARDIAPKRHAPTTTFPAPGIETFVHDGVRDPERPRATPTPDVTLTAAKRAVVAEGWR